MLPVWSISSVLEANHPLQRVMLWGSQPNWIPFHWTWKTCGLGILIQQGWQTSHSVRFNHCSHWWLGMACSGDWPVLNWDIFLLYNLLILAISVSTGLRPSHWLVWLIDWFELIDLPQLQSVKLGGCAFYSVQSVVFASDWMNGLMIQICQTCSPLSLVEKRLMVMTVMIERRWMINPSTTRTHWQCEVGFVERRNE